MQCTASINTYLPAHACINYGQLLLVPLQML
jgi:hypothetical protein